MDLTLPLATLAVLLLATVAVIWRSPFRPRRGQVRLAHAERVQGLPQYRALARERRRRLALELVAVSLAAVGVALVVGRPVDATAGAGGRSNRDVVLCLDVSGSMASVDDAVLASFADLAGRLRGERISLVAFDSASVTVFPLTDDAAYVAEQLQAFREELAAGPVAGTAVGDSGTSLVPDGLASCVQRFDGPADRSRTVVLATDNQVAGQPLVRLSRAAELAREANVLVMGVTPADNTVQATEELRDAVAATEGQVIALRGGEPVDEVVSRVEQQQRRVLPPAPGAQARFLVWPGAVLVTGGLLGATLVGRRRP